VVVEESEPVIEKVEEPEVEVEQEPVKKPKVTKKSLGKWKGKMKTVSKLEWD